MKRFLIGAFALLVGLAASAQQRSDLSPQDRADRLTESMKQQLELTDAQVQQVAPLNLKMAQEIDQVDRNDPTAKEQIKQIKAEYQRELEQILTPDQAAKAKEMADKRRQMRRQRGQKFK
jgi:hypothetical protein